MGFSLDPDPLLRAPFEADLLHRDGGARCRAIAAGNVDRFAQISDQHPGRIGNNALDYRALAAVGGGGSNSDGVRLRLDLGPERGGHDRYAGGGEEQAHESSGQREEPNIGA